MWSISSDTVSGTEWIVVALAFALVADLLTWLTCVALRR
ncbi:hypothetical protein DSM104329_02039 [Capillimicrobium parvum]|uniref:Uncharacterized protein n=1 Tax=Capillimicrobium parvum TaxID=2884022 RepID=A0A9E6XWB8_9ACTN|nr:hypothetical protein DSM104329_02039 [Capillimicrobium parvum]